MSKKSDLLRNQEKPCVLGYELDRSTLTPVRERIAMDKPRDWGCDPLGEIDGVFRWRMVPSGDIVDAAERKRRLG